MFKAVCKLGLEGIVSKKLDARTSLGKNQKSECAGSNICVWTGAFEVIIRQAAGIP
jgi:hypothetical protein